MADTSTKGQQQSITLMVNYYYDLAQIEENHENHAHTGDVAASAELRDLAHAAQEMMQ